MKIKIKYLVSALVFSTFIDYRFFSGKGEIPGFTLSEVIVYLLMGIYFGRWLFGVGTERENIVSVCRKNKDIFLYFCWVFLAMLTGLLFRSSTEVMWLLKDLLPGLLLYIIVVTYIHDMERVNLILWACLLGGIIGVFLGLSQAVFNGPYPVEENWGTFAKMDPTGAMITGNLVRGFWTHPNGFACFYVPYSILIFALLFHRYFRNLMVEGLLFLLIPLIGINYYYTYAKGPSAWIMIGIALLFMPRFLRKKSFGIGIGVISGGIAFMVLYSVWVVLAGGKAFGTVLTRMQLWIAGFEALKIDPYIWLFGNAGKTVLSLSYDLAGIDYPNTHNGILNILFFYGLPALVLYLYILGRGLSDASILMKKERRELRILGMFLFSSLVALAGTTFFEPITAGVNFQAQYFLLIALGRTLTTDHFQEA